MTPDRLGPLPGARCLVVGGCGGIGRAYVDGLLAHGARVTVIDLPVSLKEAPLPDGVMACAADATDEAAATGAVQEAGNALGGLDVFAYVAGINGKLGPIASMRSEDFRSVLEINLYAGFTTSRAALPFLKQSESAAMVFVSSSLHANAEPGFGAYAASKGGLASLMKVLAREGAPKKFAPTRSRRELSIRRCCPEGPDAAADAAQAEIILQKWVRTANASAHQFRLVESQRRKRWQGQCCF